jgi:ubiquinone/menaquinone biosynthesis C-methylase UbiE
MMADNFMFDLVHFNQMDKIISEFKRVLKRNGKLILINMTKSESFGGGLYENVYRLSPRFLGGCRGVRMTDLLTRHGFKIEVREYVQQMLFPSEVIIASCQ